MIMVICLAADNDKSIRRSMSTTKDPDHESSESSNRMGKR